MSDNIPLSPDESKNQSYCPYLKMRDDPETSMAFPSVWNYCFKAAPHASVRLEYQTEVCQTTRFMECPVYQREGNGALPKELRGRHEHSHTPQRRRRLIVFLLAIMMLGLAFWGLDVKFHFFHWLASQVSAPSGPVATASPHALQTLMPPLTPSAWLPTLPALVIPLLPFETTVASSFTEAATPAVSPVASMCGYPRDTPIGTNRRFLIHRVGGGESLNGYEAAYQTTAAAILAVNYGLHTPIPSNIVIVIPLGQTDVKGLPAFETYLAEEPDSSIASLSAKLDTDPQEFALYNNLPAVCRAFSGWLLVPKQAPTP
jgi:hypothetical protein